MKHTLLRPFLLLLFIQLYLFSEGQFVNSNGPYGGNVTSMAYKNNLLISGTMDGGVFRSKDLGKTWINCNNSILEITDILIDDTTIYVACQAGIYKSVDEGISWTKLNSAFPVYSICKFNAKIYAGNPGSLLSSSDQGETWQFVKGASVYGISTTDSCIFICGQNRILYSRNDGITWQEYFFGLAPSLFIYSIENWNDKLFACTSSGVYISLDTGLSWNLMNNNLSSSRINFIQSKDSVLYAGTPLGLYYSTDEGMTWVFSGGETDNAIIRSMEIIGDSIILSSSRGIFVSQDHGVSWSTLHHGITNTVVKTIAILDSNNVICGGVTGVSYSKNNGDSWEEMNDGLGLTQINDLCYHTGKIFAATWKGIYGMDTLNTTWHELNNGVGIEGFKIVNCLGASDSFIYAAVLGFGMLRSANEGLNWVPINNGLNGADIISFHVNNKVIVAGSSTAGVFLSTDGGDSWSSINYNISSKEIKQVVISGNYIIVSSNFGLSKLQIGETNWNAINTNLSSGVTSLSVKQDLVYAGTWNGSIYKWNDLANYWVPLVLSNTTYDILNVQFNNNKLLAGTSGKGVVIILPLENSIQEELVIYPNSCHSKFTIKLPNNQKYANLEIYSFAGRRVFTSVMNTTSETFNLPQLEEGLYVLVLIGDKRYTTLLKMNN